MAQFPFTFHAEHFYPLQPEETALEEQRRADPRNASFYILRSTELWPSSQESSPSQSSPYQDWIETCKRMDEELAIAKQAWRDAVAEKEAAAIRAKIQCEELRLAYKLLAARPKPPQPRRSE